MEDQPAKLIDPDDFLSPSLSTIPIGAVHMNVTQEVILVTVDKANLCLDRHLQRVNRQNSWKAPAGVFLALLTTLLTADFERKMLSIGPDTWHAIFVVALLISFVALIRSAVDYFRTNTTSEALINDLKNSAALRQ